MDDILSLIHPVKPPSPLLASGGKEVRRHHSRQRKVDYPPSTSSQWTTRPRSRSGILLFHTDEESSSLRSDSTRNSGTASPSSNSSYTSKSSSYFTYSTASAGNKSILSITNGPNMEAPRNMVPAYNATLEKEEEEIDPGPSTQKKGKVYNSVFDGMCFMSTMPPGGLSFTYEAVGIQETLGLPSPVTDPINPDISSPSPISNNLPSASLELVQFIASFCTATEQDRTLINLMGVCRSWLGGLEAELKRARRKYEVAKDYRVMRFTNAQKELLQSYTFTQEQHFIEYRPDYRRTVFHELQSFPHIRHLTVLNTTSQLDISSWSIPSTLRLPNLQTMHLFVLLESGIKVPQLGYSKATKFPPHSIDKDIFPSLEKIEICLLNSHRNPTRFTYHTNPKATLTDELFPKEVWRLQMQYKEVLELHISLGLSTWEAALVYQPPSTRVKDGNIQEGVRLYNHNNLYKGEWRKFKLVVEAVFDGWTYRTGEKRRKVVIEEEWIESEPCQCRCSPERMMMVNRAMLLIKSGFRDLISLSVEFSTPCTGTTHMLHPSLQTWSYYPEEQELHNWLRTGMERYPRLNKVRYACRVTDCLVKEKGEVNDCLWEWVGKKDKKGEPRTRKVYYHPRFERHTGEEACQIETPLEALHIRAKKAAMRNSRGTDGKDKNGGMTIRRDDGDEESGSEYRPSEDEDWVDDSDEEEETDSEYEREDWDDEDLTSRTVGAGGGFVTTTTTTTTATAKVEEQMD